MSDNDPDDRFSMPPIEGVWEGSGSDEPSDDPDPEDPTRRGLTLPPPGLFARLDDPPAPVDEPDAADAAETAVELPDDDAGAFDDAGGFDDAVGLDDESSVIEPVSYAAFDTFDAPEDEPAPTGLAGISDAIDIVERLAAEAETEAPVGPTPTADDLVYADAASGIAAATDDADIAEDDGSEVRTEPEPMPLPAYAVLSDLGGDDAGAQDDARPIEASAPITLPMYGDAERRDDEEEILPHFLLEESAPLDIVAAQDQLREIAHKNRVKAVDAEQRPTLARTLAEIPILLVVAAVIAFLVKTFLAQAYYIPSGSMIPQLQIDDRVVVSKLAYKFHDPRRGDIVVFDDPHTTDQQTAADSSNILRKIGEGVGVVQPSTDEFIKRVIGLPGERVSGKNGYVYIDGHKLIEPYLPRGLRTSDFDEETVAAGKLWVMGDHRDQSADSRVFGQIDIDTIVGRAVVKVWPFDHISFL